MKTQPFAIKSIPAGDTYWVVVPSEDLDSVQLCLDIGGGTGPVIATVEWTNSPSMVGGGFLCWTTNGKLQVDTPEWMPATVEHAVRDMAQAVLALQHRIRENA